MAERLLNNRYRVMMALSSGGFGETFVGEDTQMPSSRRCVIKQLKPTASNPPFYQLVQDRFQREAAILEQLSEESNQIPRLYAYFEEAGQFYLVQEWIDGETLSVKLQQQGLFSEGSVKAILMNLLLVLDYIHAKGIIHRDIKPDNILLRKRDGMPVLIDFGAVKETMGAVINSQGNPVNSILIGTPGFMPSEQASGRPTFASDLFSLGLTAIYLLTGKIPQELDADQNGEFIWQEVAGNISPSFAAVLDKAIRFHPRDRFATAKEMLEALQTSVSAIPSTEPSLPPATLVAPKTLPEKTSLASFQDWSKAAFVGVLIGAAVGVGFMLKGNFSSKSSPKNEIASGEKSSQSSNQAPVGAAPFVAGMPQVANASSFYFLADSAFKIPALAEQKRQALMAGGYNKAGLFWVPNYPNLPKNNAYQVYVEMFSDKPSCLKVLESYRPKNPQAFCGFASKVPSGKVDKPVASPN